MTRRRTVKECLVSGGVEGIKFVSGSCVYEIKRIDPTPDLYTKAYVRWDRESHKLSPQNLAWLLDDKEFIQEGK